MTDVYDEVNFTLVGGHYDGVIMGAMTSQITSLTIHYSDPEQRKHQSSASLAFVRWPAQMASNAENVSI